MNNIKVMNKGIVIINSNRFTVSLAINEDEQVNGLMHIDPPLTSMAFVYTMPQVNKFWMNHVKDDLDILFCYKGKVVEIIQAEAMTTRLLGKEQYTDLIIEFPVHISDRYDFKVGDDVKMTLSKEAANKLLSQ
jgi:uncharacterized membrane protein (UPF0127 family)